METGQRNRQRRDERQGKKARPKTRAEAKGSACPIRMAGGMSDARRWSKSGTGRGRYWFQENLDSSAPVTALRRDFAEDAVGNGAQCKTTTGELTTDDGGARISGRVNGGPLCLISVRLVDAHKTLMSLSKCARLGHTGWLSTGGGHLVLEDRTF